MISLCMCVQHLTACVHAACEVLCYCGIPCLYTGAMSNPLGCSSPV